LRDSVSGGGCSSCGNKNEPIELVKEDLPESKPIEEKTAEDLLFRSMVVPEKILNDKVQEGTV
jgi:hypothetical protein